MGDAIHLRDVVCLLGRFPALAGASLDVDRGEIVHVAGPNGAGKTTILRLCAGLLTPTSGDARVLGHDLRDRRAIRDLRRKVALLGHASFLYEELTVRDNVAFWVRAAGRSEHRGTEAMTRLGVDGRLADVAAGRLSAGQRRRVTLAILVARRPELWLLDEPHAGLDAAGRDLVDGLAADAARAGATVVVVSHELERARAMADRTVVVAGGVSDVAPSADRAPGTQAVVGVP